MLVVMRLPSINESSHHVQGTLQFMAIQILENIAYHSVPGYQLVNHETKHDLESLVWVAYYALYSKAWHNAENSEQRGVIERFFEADFGHVPAQRIYAQRSLVACRRFRTNAEMHQYFYQDDMRVVGDLLGLVEAQNRLPASDDVGAAVQQLNAMTCVKVKKRLNDTLRSIEAERRARR